MQIYLVKRKIIGGAVRKVNLRLSSNFQICATANIFGVFIKKVQRAQKFKIFHIISHIVGEGVFEMF